MIIGADARAVRPYMLCNNQLVHLFTANLSTKIKSDARAVRPYLRFLPINLSHFTAQYGPFHRAIWVRLLCNMAEIVTQGVSH